MRHYLLLALAAALTGTASASAQNPSPAVSVAIGPMLQQKAKDYGPRELVDLSKDLQDAVLGTLRHAKAPPPVKIDLVIEDAVPNRPTFDQLGRTPSLSYLGSRGIGGPGPSGSGHFGYPFGDR